VAGVVSLQNDYEFRGYSLSARRPAAALDVSVDTASGVYFGGTAIGDLDVAERPQMLGVIANVGYARRVTPTVSLDAGLTDLQLFQRYGVRADLGYTEAYVGVLTHGFSAHLHYAPDYFHKGAATVYGELDWSATTVAQLHLDAHVGLLGYTQLPADYSRHSQYDWRIGVSRPAGPFDLRLALTGGGPSPDFYDLRPHPKTAFTAGASWTF
jgi:uncharacterized protein (TIGR02001 family)